MIQTLPEKIYLTHRSFSSELRDVVGSNDVMKIVDFDPDTIDSELESIKHRAFPLTEEQVKVFKENYFVSNITVYMEEKKLAHTDRFTYSSNIELFVDRSEEQVPAKFDLSSVNGFYDEILTVKENASANMVVVEISLK